ncbi:transposase [Antarcticirhabdus aurantiaca]|uniref:transposase n=1 Tax=Antarcticirhabdus aurantiaca TaxID=2606717 RepID=UPI00131B7084
MPRNLSGRNALPAHVTFERVHRVFSNQKRWALGTFHGFREKHMNAYLNEFVFRWNRRRSFQSAMDRLLGVGQSLPRTTYRDIVGDTSEWRRAHRAQILAMVSPDRLSMAKALARQEGMDLLDALDEIGPRTDVRYVRGKPTRPALPTRRAGEERSTARYRHPPRASREEVVAGLWRHLLPGSGVALRD